MRYKTHKMQDKVRDEIQTLHRFFVTWFAGNGPNSEEVYAAGFTRQLDPGFHYIMPDGTLWDRPGISDALRGSHGSNTDFAIEISDVQMHVCQGDLVLATYIEWQTGARASVEANTGRLSTATFVRDTTARHGLRWLHVHETWVPKDQLADNPLLAGTD